MVSKRKNSRVLISYTSLIVIVLMYMLSACSGTTATPTPQPSLTATQISTPSPVTTEIATAAPENETPAPTATPLLGEMVATRAPEPTSTPGPLQQAVIDYTTRKGLASTKFLGLSVPDWINLATSVALILIGYLLGTWIIRRLLIRLIRHTPSTFDDELLKSIGPDLRWLVVVVILYFSTNRLTFVSSTLKFVLNDIYFVVGLFLLFRIASKIVELATQRIRENSKREGRETELGPVILMGNRLGRIFILILAIIIFLDHFGVNVTALTAALGLGGLAFSLAAKDTVADAIAGMIILLDRPFRVGDRIEIQEVGTWGDVIDIGLRTTRIRTRDNTMVIVPNSIVGNNQVVNYSYPDPNYRIETNVNISYGSDVETIRRLLIGTVSQVEGVLRDKAVDVLYSDMTGASMTFLIRWWIGSYTDKRRMYDRVLTAIQYALDKAGIESPNISTNVSLMVDQETTNRLSRAFKPQEKDDGRGNKDEMAADVEQIE